MTDTDTSQTNPYPPAGDVQPVPVHIVTVAAGASLSTPAAAPRERVLSGRALTVVLTSASPVQEILALNPKRRYALVQAGGNDAVINNSYAEITNGANQAAGLPNPIGMVLPYGNTVPTKIPGGQRWWASAAAYPAQVTILEVMED